MRAFAALVILLGGLGILGLPVTAPLGRAQVATPAPDTEASPVASPVPVHAETGPVFVTDEWRVSIVAAVHAPGVNAVGLRRAAGKEWVVIVADVTNLSNKDSTLDLKSFSLRFGSKRVKGFVPRTTSSVASRIGAEPTDAEALVPIAANQTKRVVWVYRVAEDLDNPVFFRGDQSVALESALAKQANLLALPPVTPPPLLQEALVDSVLDGATIAVYLSEQDTSYTVTLLGVDAPLEDECYGQESAERLEDFLDDTVWLEVPSGLASQAQSGGDQDEPLPRYVWIERDGTKVLVNQLMIAAGHAALGDLREDTRYGEWLAASQRTAKRESAGLWAVCTGPHGEPLPTPTPPPPTPTPEPVGTRANPVPIGTPVEIGGWTLTVIDVIPNATDLVLAENPFNDPPAEGRQFFIVTLSATYNGPGSDTFAYSIFLGAVGKSAVAYQSYEDHCGVIPNRLPDTEVFEGGTITGNVCWSVRIEDVDSLVMFADVGFSRDNRVYFSLKRE